jgi:dipeptidyl aminopeptidase/acylaminoacyl peptidase
LVSINGGEARQLTSGRVRDSSPSYSPDGRQLCFIRTPEGADEGQLWVVSATGGKPKRLQSLAHGASSVSWSPDGKWLAVVAPSEADQPFVVGPQPKGKAPTARRITSVDWRDDDGHIDRRSHLFLLRPRPGSKPRQLTSGDWDVSSPSWSPDGRSIAFATDRRADRDFDPRSSIWVVDVDGGEPRQVAEPPGDADWPTYSPDGRTIAFLGRDRPDVAEYYPFQPWTVSADGGDARQVAAIDDGLIGNWAWSDLDLVDGSVGPLWLDNDTLVCLVASRARCVPYTVTLGGAVNRLADPDRVQSSGMAVAGGRVVVSAAVDGRACELYVAEDDTLRRLTKDGSSWQRGYRLPVLEELTVPGPGGEINAWLASPPDAGDEARPLVVHIHGGPTGSYGPGSGFDELLWTSAGYRVVMHNFRGSAGFGYEWADALAGHWGDVDAADTHAVIDSLVERGLVDAGRIALYGLSYGGFLTQWLIGTSDRFAAAVAENGVANQISTFANCYFGSHWNRRMGLPEPTSGEGAAKLWSTSPLSNVERIHTPLLILQAESDLVCPPVDNEQLFVALRALGRPVEYVLYPEEQHEFKSYGRPDRRIDRLERIREWFGRYLG